MWVASLNFSRLYAYRLSDGTRDAGRDISLNSDNTNPTGISSDGTTMWVADDDDDKVYAYQLSDGMRKPGRDISTLGAVGNEDPYGIWSDGTTMWVADRADSKLYAYNRPQYGDPSLSALSVSERDIIGFKRRRTSYEVGVADTVTQVTVSATANDAAATVAFAPPDADVATGHQVDLSAGRNLVTVTVIAPEGATQDYTVSVNRGVTDVTGWQAGADLDGLIAAGNEDPYGIWSDGATMWVGDRTDDKLYAYNLSDGMREEGRDITLDGFNDGPSGVWSDGMTIWVADIADRKVYAYRLSDGMRQADRDINGLFNFGNSAPEGIWSDGTTMWVADFFDVKAYAYRLIDGMRQPDRDFEMSASYDPWGIWSDGTTIWVADPTLQEVLSYRLSDGTRDVDQDYDFYTLAASSVHDPRDIWSNGRTMWVVNATDKKINAYNMPNGVRFGELSYTVDEGGAVDVSVFLRLALDRDVVIPIVPSNVDDATASDYTLSTTMAEFISGETEKTITFSATDDSIDDDGKKVRLSFGTLPDGVATGIITETVVSIIDDDVPSSLTVNFGASTYTVTEGSTVEVVLTLDDDPERTVSIPLSRTNQDGASDSDYGGVPTRVIFNAGETSKSFEFSAVSDQIGDEDEKVRIDLGDLPEGITAGTTSETVVTIGNVAPQGSTTVSFGSGSYALSEGSSTTIRVVMSRAPGSDAVIPLSTTNLDGATGDDYSGVPASLTFGLTDIEKTFTFTATQDTVDDDGESVKLTFGSALPAGVSRGSVPETTVSINDDDVPSVTVSFGSATYPVDEGDTVTVTVTLSAAPEREVVVPIDTTDEDGASSADYSLSETSVTFGLTDIEKTFTFTATQDTVDDDGESVKLTFGSALPAGVSRGSVPETTVSINDDDVPSVTVSFEHPTYNVAESDDASTVDKRENEVTVKVTLSAEPERTVDITLIPANQGGAGSDDYSLSATSLTFGPTDTSKTFTFTATQDTVDDDGESVKLTFGSALPAGVSRGSVPETTVSINDDDAPSSLTVNFEASTYNVTEGSTVEVVLTLDDDPEREVIIPFSKTNQGGASDSDYVGVPTSVIFNAGEISKSFEFSAASDRIGDPGEKVSFKLENLPQGTTAGTTSETVVTIEDVEPQGSTTVSFGADTYGVSEGSSTTITVVMSHAPGSDAVIPLSTTNLDGATGDDYSGVPASLTFGPTDMEKTFTFTATQDSVDDDGESVKLTFDSPLPTGVSAGTTYETTVSITDDDVPAVTVSFELATYNVAESDDASTVDKRENEVTVKVTLSVEPERTVDITLIPANQGASDDDYSLSATTLTFGPTDMEKTFTFTATQDTVDDDGESVKLTFGSALPDGVTAGTTPETTVSINDDDVPSVTVSFDSATYPVDEGDTVTVTVTLSAAPEREVVVPIDTTDEDGASSADYSLSETSVTFGLTDIEKTFTFTATQDTVDDDGESVKLTFGSALPAGVSRGSVPETTVSINDDDVPSVTVSFGSATYPVDEGGSVTVTVTLDADPERTVVVPLSTTDQGGASGDDYSGVPANVTFNTGETLKTFTFLATDDSVDDDGESVELSFGSVLPDGVSQGTPKETVVSIIDDETVMEVSFEESSYSVEEGHGVEVVVKLDPAPDHQMDIQLQKTNVNGTSDDDYSGVPSMLTFETGETEKTFTFFAELDDEYDDHEAVEVSFVALPAMVRKGDPSKAMVTVRDNGGPSQGGVTCIDNTGARRNDPQGRAAIVTVLSERGVISSPGEIDTWVIPGVDPHRTYLVEILGADSSVDVWGQDVGGGLTLADPHPVSLYHEAGNPGGHGFNSAPGDFGTGRNSRLIFIFSTYGDFVLKVKSGESADDQGTGSYHLLVRYDNYCVVRDDDSIVFPFEGGPEGYAQDIRDDTDTRFQVSDRYGYDGQRTHYFGSGHILGDNWGSEPDEDWFRFELEGASKYEVYLEDSSRFPVEHRLTRPRIVGIFDKDGNLFHEGAAGSGTDTSVSLTFQTTSGGHYYLGVGSNPGDQTGVYSFHVRRTESGNAGHASTNNSPTGGPGITGLPTIGEVLTATVSGIDDADGLQNASFSYQWVRHDPVTNTDTDIPGATGSTYTVTRQDRDRAIKVRVEFTDDGGNNEELTSFALLILPPVNTPGGPTEPPGHPRNLTGVANADGTVTLSWEAPDDDSVTGYQILRRRPTEGENSLLVYVEDTGSAATTYSDGNVSAGIKHVYRVQAINAAGLSKRSNAVRITPTQPDEPENSPAAGGPTISGMPQVGETLRVDTSGIGDADGLTNASYSYQWVVRRRCGCGHSRGHWGQLHTGGRRQGPVHPGAGQLYRRCGQRGDADQYGDGRGGSSTLAQQSCHRRANHYGNCPCGRDAGGGHHRHHRRGWIDQRFVQLPVACRR